MRIGIDLRCLPGDGSPGAGIAHASNALVGKLMASKTSGISWTLFLPRGAESLLMKEKTPNARIVTIDNASGASLRRALKREFFDRLFVPSGAIPPGITTPVIPWVHDIAIFEHPEWFPQTLIKRSLTTELFRRGVQRAPHVLAVSEFTKGEIVGRFGLRPDRVTVTSEGGDQVLGSLNGEVLHAAKTGAKAKLAARGITNPYILCMGTLEPRKNIPMLLTAWGQARSRLKRPVDLVIAGRDGWKLEPITKALDATQVMKSEGNSRLHRVETPNDEDKRSLFLAADLVAVPSLYEGFGLTALEGMQAEVALICSDSQALPEVVGDAAMKLPPDIVEAWSDAMVKMMSDDRSRSEYARAGKARSQGMTWDKAAAVVLEVLIKNDK